ncbi:MAG: Paraquat-inducible protein [Polyangiaceae bacterium]|nr:Paraquat-inducible protein [Polyangiaceae bacterium]
MAVGTNRWKLGLFVITGVAVALGALLLLGAKALSQTTVEFVSFFDESVQGLELGSPVKFRGVTVGRVAQIDIAENLRHVQVTSQLSVEQVGKLRLAVKEGGTLLHPDMRVQLAQTGITGVKFLLIDFFDSASNPVVPLPFKPPPNYIPTASSTMKNLEDSVTRTANRFPEIADDAARAVAQVRMVAEQIQAGKLPERGAETLSHANDALRELNAQLKAINAAQLSSEAEKNLQEFNGVLVRTNALLTRLDSEQGLFRNAERSADAIGEVARNARSLGPELELTLREIRGAARSIKRLADDLDRDPDMLLKGRAVKRAP